MCWASWFFLEAGTFMKRNQGGIGMVCCRIPYYRPSSIIMKNKLPFPSALLFVDAERR